MFTEWNVITYKIGIRKFSRMNIIAEMLPHVNLIQVNFCSLFFLVRAEDKVNYYRGKKGGLKKTIGPSLSLDSDINIFLIF